MFFPVVTDVMLEKSGYGQLIIIKTKFILYMLNVLKRFQLSSTDLDANTVERLPLVKL